LKRRVLPAVSWLPHAGDKIAGSGGRAERSIRIASEVNGSPRLRAQILGNTF